MKTPSRILRGFRSALSPIADLFETKSFTLSSLLSGDKKPLLGPGVYIFSTPEHGIIRIGKSKSHCVRRSLEHIRDNTRDKGNTFEMKILENDSFAIVTYVYAKERSSYFWISSIEFYFEENLKPLIPSGRNG